MQNYKLCALAIASAFPIASHAITVSFKAPADGVTVSGTLQGAACEAAGTEVRRVRFYLDATELNNDGKAPFTCTLDTTRFANGTHTLKAVAFDKKDISTSAQITINVQNATPPANTPPTVSIQSPSAGEVISGFHAVCAATATDADGVKQVQWYLDDTLLNTEFQAPYDTCDIDTTKFVNGVHALKVVATDNAGLVGSAQVSVNVQNDATSATAPKAIATFESLGLSWKPPASPGAAGCSVQYRKSGDLEWKEGLALWYDGRNAECRGSLVHLTPDTTYEFQLTVPGHPAASGTAKTWSENFPIAEVIHVSDTSQPLNITTGGTAQGYVLYTPAAGTTATIDVANAHLHNIVISAPYVIVQGLTLKGAQSHAIEFREGARDVVITDNDISGWGRDSGKVTAEGWKVGVNGDSAIHAYCPSTPWLERTVVQRNRMHHPRYGSNSWSAGHPAGPNAIYFHECGGNHVFRYNEIYSEWGRYFVDGIGGANNFSSKGIPNADSDIYGNLIQHAWDDAIEAEGGNRNVRIWGNYIDQTTTGVATTSTHVGPVYIWRNVWNRARTYSHVALDSDQRNYMFKSGTQSGFGDGRRYLFHNTMLQADPLPGSVYPQGGGEGLAGPTSSSPVTNTVSRNNILHIWKSWWPSIDTKGGAGNDLDFDLFNGNVLAYAGAEANGILGTPIYALGHGWANEAGGNYQLDPASPGFDRGARVPNFNDGFSGAGPDMGAHEAGTPAMRFGLR